MSDELIIHNARDLNQDLRWLEQVISTRFNLYFEQESDFEDILMIEPPVFEGISSYAQFVERYHLTKEERIVVLLALVHNIRPQMLDVFFSKNADYDKEFSEFGGYKGQDIAHFVPTIETALFILTGDNLEKRFSNMHLFDNNHTLIRDNVLVLEPGKYNSLASQWITVSSETLDLVTVGEVRKPDFSKDFPAKLINTRLAWSDVVLDKNTREQLEEIKAWIKYGDVLMHDWGMKKKMQPGHHCLFYGPPGTGKTLTATLIGKETGRDVYRIDLSSVVSKYIGETEKNLSRVFDKAEHRNWILFFDEADALFGKRTEVSDAHDRYANQEVSYLLQRMESFHGVCILASNKKGNMDEAFYRRLQSIIHFPMPKPGEREQLWKNAFSDKAILDKKVDLKALAENYAVTGGTIMNVVRYSSLMALMRKDGIILPDELEKGIRREFQKEGRTV